MTKEHLDAAEKALQDVTDKATKHDDSPHEHIHRPAAQERSHSFFRAFFPYKSLEDFENAWHLGNYVIDRQTGEKSFEEMSIYVRVW